MRKLLIDCSFISTTNLNTGIQRVVRKVVENIDELCKDGDYEPYQVVLENTTIREITLTNKTSDLLTNIKPQKGDILLLLDSTWHLDNWESVAFAKDNGAKIISVVYDIIPISHPFFCDDNLVSIFKNWFARAINFVDGFIAISHTVELQLQDYLKTNFPDKVQDKQFDYFLLGADFDYREINIFLNDIREDLKTLYSKNKDIYLIVCTVEPRKNHKYLLDVFDKLWEQDINVTLNIVGKIGWKVDDIIKRIHQHPKYNKNLFHWDNLNDQELEFCYKNSKMLLFPSYIEGFGLPIVESLNNKLPVMASDIPIHREVGGKNIGYFDIRDVDNLVSKLKNIQENGIPKELQIKDDFKWINWSDSTKMLFDKLNKMNTSFILKELYSNIFPIPSPITYIVDIIIQSGIRLTDAEYMKIAQKLKDEY
jgi:glycosyltransferase involved in cell wall biosynthesis